MMDMIFNPADYPTKVQRAGVPFTRPAQMHLLKWLYDPSARITEQPFKPVDLQALGLPAQAHTSLSSLIKRDWIVASTKVFDGIRYQITGRGIKALKIINQSTRKQYANDLCSNCHQRPRKQYPARLHTYCHECILEKQRKTRRFKGHMHDPNKPCSRCHAAPRRISRSGEAYVYCTDCQRSIWREGSRRR